MNVSVLKGICHTECLALRAGRAWSLFSSQRGSHHSAATREPPFAQHGSGVQLLRNTPHTDHKP
jgi:hypothetical protein